MLAEDETEERRVSGSKSIAFQNIVLFADVMETRCGLNAMIAGSYTRPVCLGLVFTCG